jgi:hypothetical protein
LRAAVAVAVVAVSVAACEEVAPDAVPLGEPLRVGDTTFHATEASVVEWMPIDPDHPDRDPYVWRPATLYMRQRGFVPSELSDADLWVNVRLEIFSDSGPRDIFKDDLALAGGDGETYRATFARDLARDGDATPWLPQVVASSISQRLLTTEAYPDGGEGSFASVEAVYAVATEAVQGARLVIADPESGESAAIDLGAIPVVQPEGAPQPHG